MSRRLILVSARVPRLDGQGDQLRAAQILEALADDWDVEVVSWLPEMGPPREAGEPGVSGPRFRPFVFLKALVFALGRPCQVSYMQAHLPREARNQLAASRDEVTVFVTDRAVTRVLPAHTVVDFIDDLGAAARRRAQAATGVVRLFWRIESWRTHRFDRRLARRATVSVAISPVDAHSIAPTVRVIPNSIRPAPMPNGGDKVVFLGNLFYAPNHEAAVWICTALAPYLQSVGIQPDRIIVAGRRPQPSLQAHVAAAGVDLRPDVPDLAAVLLEAAVVIAPMNLGSGMQNKILDAVGSGRPCVLSPMANAGLGLVDGQSALVRDLDPKLFGDAVVSLLTDAELGRRLVDGARRQLIAFTRDEVASAWRAVVADCAGSAPGRGPEAARPTTPRLAAS